MPTHNLQIERWRFDLDGNPVSSQTQEVIPSGGLLVKYKNDGHPLLRVDFAPGESPGYYDYEILRSDLPLPNYPELRVLVGSSGDAYSYGYYDPDFPSGLSSMEVAALGYQYFGATSGAYRVGNGAQIPVYGVPSSIWVEHGGQYGTVPINVGYQYNLIGTVSHTIEAREIALVRARADDYIVDIQSNRPFVRFKADVSVRPNISEHGMGGWQPTADIYYRIKLRSPQLPGGFMNLDGVIPANEISAPNLEGVVASIDHLWDGRVIDLPYFCELPLDVEIRAVMDTEEGGNTIAVAPGFRIIVTSCRGKQFQMEATTTEDISIFPEAGTGINPQLSYRSFSSSMLPSSMGYGWFSTENIRVFEVPEDLSLVFCNNGSWTRWLKTASGYEPLFPDNKLEIVKNNDGYTVWAPDRSRREFDTSGNLTADVSSHGNITSYVRFANYLKVNDHEGREVFYHFALGAHQPTVMNDNVNPELGKRYVLTYWGTSDVAPDRLRSITDPAGQETRFFYNAAGRLTERREVRPTEGDRSVFYSYGGGTVARLIQLRAATSKFDPQSQQVVARNHFLISYAYNVPVPGFSDYTATQMVYRDLQSNTPSTDKVIYMAHDTQSRMLAQFELLEIDSNGERKYLETYFEYSDPANPYSVTRFTAPNQAVTEYQYTPRGNVQKVTDDQGNETVYTYTENEPLHPAHNSYPDLVTKVRRPAPDRLGMPNVFLPEETYGYDEVTGDLTTIVDAQGRTTYLRYDELGRLRCRINRLGFKTYFAYDLRGRLVGLYPQTSLSPSCMEWEFEDEVLSQFKQLHLFYNDYDCLIRLEDANGVVLEAVYDEIGRPRILTNGDYESKTTFEYLDGVLKQVGLPENNLNPDDMQRCVKLHYDPLGRVTAIVQKDNEHADQLRVGFGYNGFSQLRYLRRLKNGVEKDHSVDSWDRQGRVLQTTDANEKSSYMAYEPFCVGRATTSARGVRRKISFDSLCRLTQVETGTPDVASALDVAASREVSEFEYDDLGRLLKTKQGSASGGSVYGQAVFGVNAYGASGSASMDERSYIYDSLDRVKMVTFEDGKTLEYFYDFEGNVTKVVENASGTSQTTQFSYYGDNRLYQVTYVRASGNQVFTYDYDPGGRPKTLTYPASTGIVAKFEGPNNEPGWDGNGQLKHLCYKKGLDTIRRFAFEYDLAGNRISQLDVVDIAQPLTQRAVEWVYGYDWLDRLESVKKREATTVAGLALESLQLTSVYQYDAADNRIEFKVPNLQQPALTETFTYSYDDADNILSISKAVGTGSASEIEAFTSDADGNMKTRTSGGVTTIYTWNDFNRLAAISTSDNSKKQSHTFGVNGFRRKKKDQNDVETTEYAAGLATAVSKAQAGDTITYLIGHRLMGFERQSDGAMFWFLSDALGSVRDIVRGTDGAVLQSYDYKENGEKTTVNGFGPKSDKTWVGGLSVNDDVGDSGLYLMGHRQYDPSLGRFLSQDPIGFAGGLNLYEYAGNAPIQYVDAEGLELGIPLSVYRASANKRYVTGVTRQDRIDGTLAVISGATAIFYLPELAAAGLWYGGNALFQAGAKRIGAGFMAAGESGAPWAATGVAGLGGSATSRSSRPCQDPVDEATIRRALAGSNMRTMQPSVSLPRVQQNVARLRAGETPGPITVYENIIVDGNHRYVAGRVFGLEPSTRPGMLSSTQTQYSKPITDIIVDVVNFFD